jgi:8-oxo-dGTP pyrophosphatase MutT (NUDIX family)
MTVRKLPNIKVYPVNEPSDRVSKDFLTIKKQWFEISYPNLTRSPSFRYDSVERRALDAVTIIAHYELSGVRVLYLRSCIRPAMHDKLPEHVSLWEFAAGLIEGGESPIEAAQRECEEELGFKLSLDKFKELGSFMLPTPGICAERIHFVEVEVDPADRTEPTLDGSPLEKHGLVEEASLDTILNMVINGELPDAKTQIGAWRMAWKYKFKKDM